MYTRTRSPSNCRTSLRAVYRKPCGSNSMRSPCRTASSAGRGTRAILNHHLSDHSEWNGRPKRSQNAYQRELARDPSDQRTQ